MQNARRWRTGGCRAPIAAIRGARIAIATMAILGAVGVATAQEYRGTDEQRQACTSDVMRLCSAEVPDVNRIVACLHREKPRLSPGCRAVFDTGSATSRVAADGAGHHRHASLHHSARRHHPKGSERTELGRTE
jgi:hypothetical protein